MIINVEQQLLDYPLSNVEKLANYFWTHSRSKRDGFVALEDVPSHDQPKSFEEHTRDAERLLPRFISNIVKGLEKNSMGLITNIPGDVLPRQPLTNSTPARRPSPGRSIESAPLPGNDSGDLHPQTARLLADMGGMLHVGSAAPDPVFNGEQMRPLGLPVWDFSPPVGNAGALVGSAYGSEDVSPGRSVHSVFDIENEEDDSEDGDDVVETDVPQERVVNVPPAPNQGVPKSQARAAQDLLRRAGLGSWETVRQQFHKDTLDGGASGDGNGGYGFPQSSGVPSGPGYDE